MTNLLLQRAHQIASDIEPAETSLLIVAHGTDLNENSAAAAKRETEKIRALGKYATVLNVYMEEPPLVSEWRKLTGTPNVVAVPFLFPTDYAVTKTFRPCWESQVEDRRRLHRARAAAKANHRKTQRMQAPRSGREKWSNSVLPPPGASTCGGMNPVVRFRSPG